MNAETPLQNAIRVRAGQLGCALFRNTVGKLQDAQTGKWIAYGLGPGSSDLIGWRSDGRFLAIEVKVPGHRTEPKRLAAQVAFVEAVRRAGGAAGFADSVEAAERIIRG